MPQITAQTTAQLFQQIGLPQWWNHPSQRFGQADVMGGIEQGTDFALPYGSKVGSISGGKVVYVGTGGYNDPSLGKIVQIQGADGSILHYQHLASSGLKVGQLVQPGSLIGLSGGQRGRFSSGPHIEVRFASIYSFNSGVWSQHWIDPLSTISKLSGGKPAGSIAGSKPYGTGAGPTTSSNVSKQATSTLTTGSSNVAPVGGAGASFSLPTVSIGPNDDVTTVLWTIDEIMQVVPPWNVVNAQQDSILGTTFTDPISWFEGFLFNVGLDLVALLLRFILLAWGLALGYKVLSTFVDLGALQSSAKGLAGLGQAVAAA